MNPPTDKQGDELPTPLTDAVIQENRNEGHDDFGHYFKLAGVLAKHAQQLERKLARSKAGECLKCGVGPSRETCAYPEGCEHPGRVAALERNQALLALSASARLIEALRPLARLGGPDDGCAAAFHDLEDDVVVYENSGRAITAGDVRRARALVSAYVQPKAAPQPKGDAVGNARIPAGAVTDPSRGGAGHDTVAVSNPADAAPDDRIDDGLRSAAVDQSDDKEKRANIPCPRCGVNEGEKCRDFNHAEKRCNDKKQRPSREDLFQALFRIQYVTRGAKRELEPKAEQAQWKARLHQVEDIVEEMLAGAMYREPEWLSSEKPADDKEHLSSDTRELAEGVLRLTQTLRYLIGIAERGEGRPILDAETPEQFVLRYVQRLERDLAIATQCMRDALAQGEKMEAKLGQCERELADLKHDMERSVANHSADINAVQSATAPLELLREARDCVAYCVTVDDGSWAQYNRRYAALLSKIDDALRQYVVGESR